MNDFNLLDPVVNQAQTWGFICQYQESKSWQILPQKSTQKWKLEQVEKRWILSIDDIPQLRLDVKEAIAFLANHR